MFCLCGSTSFFHTLPWCPSPHHSTTSPFLHPEPQLYIRDVSWCFFFSLIHSSIPSHRPLLFCSMGRPHPKITAHWSCTCEDVKCQAAGQYTTAVVVVDSTQTYCHITCSHTDLTNVYKWNSNTRPRSHTLNLINWTLSDTVNRNTLNDTTYFPHLDSVTRMMM